MNIGQKKKLYLLCCSYLRLSTKGCLREYHGKSVTQTIGNRERKSSFLKVDVKPPVGFILTQILALLFLMPNFVRGESLEDTRARDVSPSLTDLISLLEINNIKSPSHVKSKVSYIFNYDYSAGIGELGQLYKGLSLKFDLENLSADRLDRIEGIVVSGEGAGQYISAKNFTLNLPKEGLVIKGRKEIDLCIDVKGWSSWRESSKRTIFILCSIDGRLLLLGK